MKKHILLLFLIGLAIHSNSQTFDFVKKFGGPDVDRGSAACYDDEGNFFIAGSYRDSVDFDPGPNVVKIHPKWTYEMFISKFDSSGNFLWTKMLPGSRNQNVIRFMKADHSGNIYIGGLYEDTLDIDPTLVVNYIKASYYSTTYTFNPDVFILKISNNGDYLWSNEIKKSAGGVGISGIAVDSLNNLTVIGNFNQKINFLTNSGNHYVTPTAAYENVYAAKYSQNGTLTWTKIFGNGIYVTAVGSDRRGGLYLNGMITGYANFDPWVSGIGVGCWGQRDIYVAKYNSEFAFQWVNAFGSTNDEIFAAFAVNQDGTSLTSGSFGGVIDFDNGPNVSNMDPSDGESFLVTLDSAGKFISCGQLPIQFNLINSIAADYNNIFYITGSHTGLKDLNPSPSIEIHGSTTPYTRELFIIKQHENGDFISAKGIEVKCEIATSALCTSIQNHLLGINGIAPCYDTIDFNPDAPVDTIIENGLDVVFFQFKNDATILSTPFEDKTNSIVTYPNPCHNELNIEMNIQYQHIELELFDIVGKLIMKKEFQNQNRIKIDLESMRGIYVLRINTNQSVYSKKIQIE